MRVLPFLALSLLSAALFSGCTQTEVTVTVSPGPAPETLPAVAGFRPFPVVDVPQFSKPLIVDNVRAGGEPVIAVTQEGSILISAHPGFTHYHPSDPTHIPLEILQEYGGQVYLFRSTDHGATWSPIGAPGGMGKGPRSAGLGVSDPDFTVMADGTICYTDLEALAAASTSCSEDDGVTWLTAGNPGNAAASGRPVDRQWLASYQDEFYFTANYLSGVDMNFRASTDKGMTWEDRGTTPCGGDVIANPANGHLYQSCNGVGITVSTDGGRTWSEPSLPAKASDGGTRNMNEPALDSAGNVWVTWTDGERSLHVAGTPDEGKTWPWVYDLTPHFRLASDSMTQCIDGGEGLIVCEDPPVAHEKTNGSYVWPWVSAGSAGRIAVSWIGSFDTEASDSYDGAWFVFTAYLIDANSDAPAVVVRQLTPSPIHVGPICQAGTLCQATSMQGDPSGDRRLGDFFETTVEPGTGYLLGSWANTHDYPDDVVGHVQFVRQIGGVSLLTDEDKGTFTPMQG